jgi:hypothetical protein
MQLRHLAIGQSSYSKHGQIEFFLAGVQPHFPTLQELCLGDSGLASDVNDLLEIALCAWLRDLRIPLPKDILVSLSTHRHISPHLSYRHLTRLLVSPALVHGDPSRIS